MAVDNSAIYGASRRRRRRLRSYAPASVVGNILQAYAGPNIRAAAGLDPYDTSKDTGVAGQGAQAPQQQPTGTPAAQAPGVPRTFNPAYEEGMANLGQRYGNLVGQYQWGSKNLSQQYGFDENGNEITDRSNPLFNPFNRMALLRESFATANKSTSGSMASRGQLYSGALQSRLNNNRHTFDINDDSLRREYSGGRRALLDAWLSGLDDLSDYKYGLGKDDVEFQLDHPPGALAAYGPDGVPGTKDDIPTHGKDSGSLRDVVFKRPPKPDRDPKPGFKWVFRDGKWVQRKRRTIGALPGGSR